MYTAKGISLHIGLNFVDPKHYQGWDGQLNIADAKDMRALAKKKGFTGNTMLLNTDAELLPRGRCKCEVRRVEAV